MTPQEELADLRGRARMDELEARAGGSSTAPSAPAAASPVMTPSAQRFNEGGGGWDNLSVAQRLGNALTGTAKDAGQAVRGLAEGVPTNIAGAPGDVEALGRAGYNAASALTTPSGATAPSVSPQPYFNTSSQLADKWFGQPQSEDQAAGRMLSGMALPPLAKGVQGAANIAGKVAGGLGKQLLGWRTGTGPAAIEETYKAGKAGGQANQAFLEQMRGTAPASDAVDTARAAVDQLGQERSAAYRAGINSTIKGDPTILDFKPVDQAIRDAAQVGVYKGKVLSSSAEKVWKSIENVVDDWRQSAPQDFHTPEGLDALKKKIGDLAFEGELQAATAPGSPGSKILSRVYGAIKGQITAQAPGYAEVMKDYSNASDEMREIEKGLSLGHKATVDTGLRKLQSILRNNANTNYGARVEMGKTLDSASGGMLMPKLAGQAMSSWLPRGLSGAEAGIEGTGAIMTGNAAYLPLLAASSPRIVGEATNMAGRLAGALQQSPVATALGNVANVGSPGGYAALTGPQLMGRLLAQPRQQPAYQPQ